MKKKISYTAIRHILIEENILIDTLNRKTKKIFVKFKGNQPRKFNTLVSFKFNYNKPSPTQKKIVKFGEIYETDTSNHHWIKNLKYHLHIVFYKSSKTILAGYFQWIRNYW